MTPPLRLALLARLGRASRHPPPPPPTPPRRRRPHRRIGVLFLLTALATGTLLALVGGWLLSGGLPVLEGTIAVAGLGAEVHIDRDARGVPTIRGADRADVAFALGFAHGQDRFFQMDLLRRHPAGELAALFGPGLLREDRRMRVHRFRARARRELAALPAADRAILTAYTAGVEAGRRAVRGTPWERRLVGRAEPWRDEDSLLVVFGMYQMLQEGVVGRERMNGLMADLLPKALADFLSPEGSPWDAPLVGGPLPARPIPAADDIDLRKRPTDWQPPRVTTTVYLPPPLAGGWVGGEGELMVERPALGSNNWAVAGRHTAHKGALLANDMHLGLMVPNIWYRASLEWPGHRVTGVTLPGAPAVVVGSNTHIAWGLTNVEGDFCDLVVLETDPARPGEYRAPDGWRAFARHEEAIVVTGGRDETLVVEETVWGPVYDRDHKGRSRALCWVAHQPGAVNLEMMHLETAATLEEALAIAPRAGAPANNLVVADDKGEIAWTIIGRVPRRLGHDGRLPASWADGKRRWDGWLAAADYPSLLRPAEGRLWTANNRAAAAPALERLGLGNYDHGARAKQIRDGLRELKGAREEDMLRIQLDDRALFLARWQRLLADLLTGPEREPARREVRSWGGRAAVDSVGYRLVRRFHRMVREAVLRPLVAPCLRADRRAHEGYLDANSEESLWLLVTERPAHLLPPGHPSWEALLVGVADRLLAEARPLSRYTWGRTNRASIQHPFSASLGPAALLLRLDMPAAPQPGDSRWMPRIQAPSMGASQRLAVSPGREHEGYFHMPAGQSDHPLSPHYRDGHDDWASGRASPFLPGPAVHALRLAPAR